MGNAFIIMGFIVVGFILFCVYFIFKQIEFVVVSVNLFRKMVHRQDAMVKLLIDIRDNTKNYRLSSAYEEDAGSTEASSYDNPTANRPGFCHHCGENVPDNVAQCPSCWKIL